jgi:ABC-type uncharacterized transport system auxiliary subunit
VIRRMSKTAQLTAVGLLLTVAGGCGSMRAVKYYTLEQPMAAAPAPANPYPVSLLVGRLRSTRLLQDDRIVYGMTPVEMGVYAWHRWAEPPPEMIETMLLERLRATQQYKSVERLAGAARGDYIVRGRILSLKELDQPSGVLARFSIELELFQPKTGTVVWTRSYEHDEPVSQRKATVNDVVEAMQKNVDTGLGQLTASLGEYFASQAAK